jgi:hypothetical protein
MNRFVTLSGAASVLLAVAACGFFAPGNAATEAPPPAGAQDSEFPLPDSVSNLTKGANGGINFQTEMDLQTTIEFYRDALGKTGLKERAITTAITETTFSLVFDGDPSGRAIVVQGVDLGGGMTNVNIRYEDV